MQSRRVIGRVGMALDRRKVVRLLRVSRGSRVVVRGVWWCDGRDGVTATVWRSVVGGVIVGVS